jgi:hypothetical protein
VSGAFLVVEDDPTVLEMLKLLPDGDTVGGADRNVEDRNFYYGALMMERNRL